MWALGLLLVALGVAVCGKSDLGVSMIAAPAFIVSEFLSRFSGFFSVGTTEYLLQALLILIMCLTVRRFDWRYLTAFLTAVIYGYIFDLFLYLLRNVSFETAAARWVMLLIGDVLVAAGVACFFHTYLPLQAHELFVAETSRRFSLNIRKVKWIFDLSFLALSVFLALVLFRDAGEFDWAEIGYRSYHSIGPGTIVTTVINAPVIALAGKAVERFFDASAAFPRLEKIMKRKG